MAKLKIIGDGLRDKATLPPIVRSLLGCEFEAHGSPWQAGMGHLHKSQTMRRGKSLKGYGRKLYLELRSARANGLDGLVAVVDQDRDRSGSKLKSMADAREIDREERASLATALGEAIPHNEAWLLDDLVAVRIGLALESDADVPVVTRCRYPKSDLTTALDQSAMRGAAA